MTRHTTLVKIIPETLSDTIATWYFDNQVKCPSPVKYGVHLVVQLFAATITPIAIACDIIAAIAFGVYAVCASSKKHSQIAKALIAECPANLLMIFFALLRGFFPCSEGNPDGSTVSVETGPSVEQSIAEISA